MIWIPILLVYLILGFFTLVIDIRIEGIDTWRKYDDGDAVFVAFCCFCFWPIVLVVYSFYLLYKNTEPFLRNIARRIMGLAIKLSGVDNEEER